MSLGVLTAPQRRVFAAFFIYAFALGNLFPRLGDIQLAMGIREGALGGALMGIALGSQISLMFAGPHIERAGYRRSLLVLVPLASLLVAVASLAPTPLVFFSILVLVGLVIGGIEIIINVEADRTEALIGRRVMNRAHAFWSFGMFAAGLVGAVVRQIGISPPVHLFAMVLVITGSLFLVLRHFDPAPARAVENETHPVFVRPTAAILVLVGFTLSAMLLEGAGSDWSVIFMRDVFATAPFVSGLAFAAGSFAQAAMRFFADRIVERFGPVPVARTLITTLGTGAVLVVFSIHPAMALIGFALMGMGTSAIFPLAMSAAAQRTDRPAIANVAALAQLSFITFLVAPPLLGFVAQHLGIRFAFALGLPLVIVSFFTVSVLSPARPAKPVPAHG